MRKDLTNFWLAWRETCDVRRCMDEEMVRKTCAASPEIAADAKAIASDAVELVKTTNKAMAGWISCARKVEALKWASGNVSADVDDDDDEEECQMEGPEESEDEADGFKGASSFSRAEESDDDEVARRLVIQQDGQKFARASRVSEFAEYIESWRKDDLSVVSAFELIQVDLYAKAQKGATDADGKSEPLMNGKQLKSYLFEDIGGRTGGLSQNLWGYLLKKKMVYVNGRPYPSRLIMVAKDSFKHSAVESLAPEDDPTPVVVPSDIEKTYINEAAGVFRKHLDEHWERYSVKARVALCCAFMGYNMCDACVEQITGTSGKRLSDVKNRCVGEVFLALKNGGCEADTVRGLFAGKGQSVLMEYADKDDACRLLVEHFKPRRNGAGK